MLKRLNSLFFVAALLALFVVAAAAHPFDRRLLEQLPPSDLAAVVDLQRLQNETLPRFGDLNASIMRDINRGLADIQKETGLDPRVFERVAVGARLRGANPDQFVLLVQGRFNAAEIIETGYASAQRKDPKLTREARIYEGATIFIFGSKSRKEDTRDAVAALDGNTLVFGDFAGVRAAIDARAGRARISDDVVNLAANAPDALVSFGGIVPDNAAKDLGLGDDKMGNLARSIRRFSGSFNSSGLDLDARLNLFTETADQAGDIVSALNGLRLLFGSGLRAGGASKQNADQIKSIINRAQVTAVANEVQLRLTLNEADLRSLLHFL
jgi:hypothetical protein